MALEPNSTGGVTTDDRASIRVAGIERARLEDPSDAPFPRLRGHYTKIREMLFDECLEIEVVFTALLPLLGPRLRCRQSGCKLLKHQPRHRQYLSRRRNDAA